ncbi:hypothetical protein [Nocardia callitridis]|uniref:Uncharacterized protein n=1 Tax=Nocardia callitridis TaxID=648753 RepID=A0ABP9KTC1_9NOCA
MDWRATASQQVQDDLDGLLRDSVNAVARMLGTANSFNPFMLVIENSGGKSMRLAPNGFGGGQESIIAALAAADDSALLRARVSVFDVTAAAPVGGDAIKVVLEHRDGVALDVLVPYSVTAESIDIDLNSANGARGAARLWP